MDMEVIVVAVEILLLAFLLPSKNSSGYSFDCV